MDNKSNFWNLSAAAIFLGLSIVAGTLIVGATMYRIKNLANNISVSGAAERVIKSDTVKWASSFSRQVMVDQLKTGSAELKGDLTKVLAYFSGRDVAKEIIQVQPPTMTVVCENQQYVTYDASGLPTCGSGKIIGYNLQQNIIIESNEVDKITALAQEAPAALVDQGVIFNSKSLEYYYNKLADLKLEMMGEATKNAMERASRIAESTGRKINQVQSATMGVFQVTSVNSTDISDYGFYDTSAIQKKVTAVVRASFDLK